MGIVKESVEKLWESISYTYKEQYSNTFLNKLHTYWCFFEEKEDEIQKISGMSLETILYSKYYWCTRFAKEFLRLYGYDAGVQQQQYQIIEEIAQRMNTVNWKILEMIEESM